ELRGADASTPVRRALLSTALRNVRDNGLRYRGPGAPVAMGVRSAPDAGVASIEVADRGPGMSEAELANAGQRFRRGTRGGTGGDGAGLGPSSLQAVMPRYGGSVRRQARPGGGLSGLL